jgi:5-formyltetrahydrofolate cyclo-ligase
VITSSLILKEKQALRARMRAWRGTLGAEEMASAGEAIARHGLGFLPLQAPGAIVSGFAPMPDELRVWSLLRRLGAEGFRLALPVMQGKGLPLLFRAWKQGDALDKGTWDIAEPRADKPVLEPDVVLVPLLAFDRKGWRLGYGGGFYDRTLAYLRAHKAVAAVGLGYDGQEVDWVPHASYDQRLDWVLTPSGPIKCVD